MDTRTGRIAMIGPFEGHPFEHPVDQLVDVFESPEAANEAGYTTPIERLPNPNCPRCKGTGSTRTNAGKKIKFKPCKCVKGNIKGSTV